MRLGFKVATASAAPSNGGYVVREITSDTALVLSSGSSLGTLINEESRVYVAAIDNNGTVEAAVYNPKAYVSTNTAVRVTQLYRPAESATLSTTAEGGAGGADSAATMYSTSARTGVYLRRLGYFDVRLGSTSGNWSNNPKDVTVIGPGVPVTGDIIQEVATYTYSNPKSTTNTCPSDGTIPQISEGALGLWATMTHTKDTNPVLVESQALMATNQAAASLCTHLHVNSALDAILTGGGNGTANCPMTVYMSALFATTSAGATGYYVIYSGDTSAISYGGDSGASAYGPTDNTNLVIKEICA